MTAATVQPDKTLWRGKFCREATRRRERSCWRAAGLRCRLRIAFRRLRRRWMRRARGASIWPRRTTRIFTWLRGFCPRRCGRIFTRSMPIAASRTIWATRWVRRRQALALLDLWGRELDACYEGRARHPVFVALARDDSRVLDSQGAVCGSADGVSAGSDGDALRDRWSDVLGYCRYSANPVGRLVLYACGEVSEEKFQAVGCDLLGAATGQLLAGCARGLGARTACICRRTTCGDLA